jgi:hypothetical protein
VAIGAYDGVALAVADPPLFPPPLFPPPPSHGPRDNRDKPWFPRSMNSRAIVKLRLEVPAAIENAFDEHRLRRDDEGDGHAPLESCHPQSG